jgi:hypothetical protein
VPGTEKACRSAAPGARPAFIEFVQTFGDLVNFHLHVHVLAADGVFRTDGTFLPLPPLPETLLEVPIARAPNARPTAHDKPDRPRTDPAQRRPPTRENHERAAGR